MRVRYRERIGIVLVLVLSCFFFFPFYSRPVEFSIVQILSTLMKSHFLVAFRRCQTDFNLRIIRNTHNNYNNNKMV